MTDLEMTRLCAEAMGIKGWQDFLCKMDGRKGFDPLHDDAQAMALVKKLFLCIEYEAYVTAPSDGFLDEWRIYDHCINRKLLARSVNLNRAIVECVAKMQQAKP